MSEIDWEVGADGIAWPGPVPPGQIVQKTGLPAVIVDVPRDTLFTGAVDGGITATDADLAALVERAKDFAAEARSEATRRAYRTDWAHFAEWCAKMGIASLPATPRTVGTYLTAHADALKISTLTRRISSIATAHRMSGHRLDTGHPDLRETWRGIRRARGTAQRRVEALTVPLLKRVLAEFADKDRLIDVRDRALLLVGFAGAFRRAELCALDVADVTGSPEGLTIRLTRSKGDQEGEGAIVPIGRTGRGTCPATAYESWITAAGITDGRAFRSVDRHSRAGTGLSTRAVAQIVKDRAGAAGLDAEFSGHSMRSGFATAAAMVGIEEREIMRQTRHQSVTVARRYIRDGDRWRRNLAAEIGL